VSDPPQPDSGLRVEQSNTPEISANIIEEVAAWGTSEGYPNWIPGSFAGPDSRGVSHLLGDIAVGALYLVWRGDEAVATISLLEVDPMFWPNAGNDALYVHRFAVRRAAAGAGRTALLWCTDEARRRGRSFVRLDCLRDNPGIRRYYERFGFVAVDEKVINGTSYALYEIAVSRDS
jgi:GNAT superfamily N-acetyltransferase